MRDLTNEEQQHQCMLMGMGFAHRDGTYGLPKDEKQAVEWFRQAAMLGDPRGLTSCGYHYCAGIGIDRNCSEGLVMLGQAAGMGAEHACYYLGWAYERGAWTLKQDASQARRLYRKMDSCSVKNSHVTARNEATKWLRDNPER